MSFVKKAKHSDYNIYRCHSCQCLFAWREFDPYDVVDNSFPYQTCQRCGPRYVLRYRVNPGTKVGYNHCSNCGYNYLTPEQLAARDRALRIKENPLSFNLSMLED